MRNIYTLLAALGFTDVAASTEDLLRRSEGAREQLRFNVRERYRLLNSQITGESGTDELKRQLLSEDYQDCLDEIERLGGGGA